MTARPNITGSNTSIAGPEAGGANGLGANMLGANVLGAILGDDQFEAIISGDWVEPAATLARALGIADSRIVVGGNDAFPLVGHGRCWLVLHGSVDLFWADATGRTFVARIAGGGILDAFSAQDGPARMVAVPTSDTELAETTRAALYTCARAGKENGAFGRIWMLWHDALIAKAAPVHAALPHSASAAPAEEREKGPHWEELVDALNQAVLVHASALRAQTAEAREARLAQARDATERDFAGRLGAMANALRHPDLMGFGGAPFTLMDAARTVFSALRLDRDPIEPPGAEAVDEAEAIRLFAQDNDLQTRSIRLGEAWWRADHGPLLAFAGPERRPCALLPASRDGYWLVTGERRQRVDAALAASVDPVACSFSPALPKETITPWRLFRYGIAGGGGDLRNVVICMIIAGFLSLVTPLAMGWLMNPVIPSADRNQVYMIGLVLFAAGLCGAINTTAQSFAVVRLEGAMDNRIQSGVWIRILNLPSAFFRGFTAGDLANRADSVDSMRQVLGQSLNLFMVSAISAIFSFGLMVWYDWRVALLVLLACAVFGGITYAVGRQVLTYNRQTLDVGGRAQGLVLQMISAIAKLRVAGAERRAFLEWLALYRRNIDLGLRQGTLSNRLRVFRAVFEYLVPLLVLGVIGYQMGILFTYFHFDDGTAKPVPPPLSTGQFVSFNAAFGQFLGSAFAFTRGNLSLAMVAPLYERVKPILLAQEEENAGHGHLSAIRGDIEFRNVSFRYAPEQPLALKDLSFTVAPGAFTAVVGPSGAGKSSIMRLLLGFEEPESGAVLVDGNDVRFLNRRDLRRQYGVVLQDGGLLSGSVFDNVAAGLPFSQQDVMEALRIADLDGEVASWPMGLGTLVGNSSSTISRGQRQRLMIARAVIRRPQVLILDEATSALDNLAQARVTANLKALGRTQIVIAHRLSTIIDADRIVVIDAGTVAETGTYAELMERDGLFARLARRQME